MQASPPPASTTSASPRRISSAASMTACAPVEQAEMGARLWPRRSSSVAIAPLATSGRHCGRNHGATRSQPRSRRISCCSIIVWKPPMAVPKSTPKRVGSSTTSAASSAAACAAASASRTLRSMRRASLAPGDGDRVEALDLARHADRHVARVELRDLGDAGAPREQRLPGLVGREADRRDAADARDRDALHATGDRTRCCVARPTAGPRPSSVQLSFGA